MKQPKRRKYHDYVAYVIANPGKTRREIMMAVYGKYRNRGELSSMWAKLISRGLVRYDSEDLRYYPTEAGAKAVANLFLAARPAT